MFKGLESVLLGSSNAKKLAEFYEKKVGLKLTTEAEMGEDNEALFGFELKGTSSFYVMDHSKVEGKSKDPSRIIINFEVNDIDEAVKKLDANKVKKVQDKYHLEGYGYIATYEDIDGNYFQVVQVRSK